MRWFYHNMIGYWVSLLTISLVIAAVIYVNWLADKVIG
jgi:hypothetical protein